jgi:glycosyltransferase involved in cell wall biosynthesis
VVTLASPTWLPSLETVRRIASTWWPEVRSHLPDATLHVFGGVPGDDGNGVVWHGAPRDSIEAFAGGAVMAIPARHPTGVPVKALEAWARGAPLVVSSQTAVALGTSHGCGVAVADEAQALAQALTRIEDDAEHRRSLIEGGRKLLASRHDPARIATQLTEIYRELAS